MGGLIFFIVIGVILLPFLLSDMFRAAKRNMAEAEYKNRVAENKANASQDRERTLGEISDAYSKSVKEREELRSAEEVYDMDDYYTELKAMEAADGLSKRDVEKEFYNKHPSAGLTYRTTAKGYDEKVGMSKQEIGKGSYFTKRNYYVKGKVVFKKFGYAQLFESSKDHERTKAKGNYAVGYLTLDAWLVIVETEQNNKVGVLCSFPLKDERDMANSKIIEDLQIGTNLEVTGELIRGNFSQRFRIEELNKYDRPNVLNSDLHTIYTDLENIKFGS